MLSSIHPLGERARNQRWAITIVAYIAASGASGALTGAVGGLAGSMLPTSSRLPAVLAIATGAILFELAGARVPSWNRQVNEDWLTRYRGWVYGIGFGVQLGSGLATTVTSASVYATFALAVITGDALAGSGIGLAFGAARGAAIWGARHVDTTAALVSFHQRLQARLRTAHLAVVLVGALVGVAALVELTT